MHIVHVYVHCVYVYIYTHICTYRYTHVCAHIYMYVFVFFLFLSLSLSRSLSFSPAHALSLSLYVRARGSTCAAYRSISLRQHRSAQCRGSREQCKGLQPFSRKHATHLVLPSHTLSIVFTYFQFQIPVHTLLFASLSSILGVHPIVAFTEVSHLKRAAS